MGGACRKNHVKPSTRKEPLPFAESSPASPRPVEQVSSIKDTVDESMVLSGSDVNNSNSINDITLENKTNEPLETDGSASALAGSEKAGESEYNLNESGGDAKEELLSITSKAGDDEHSKACVGENGYANMDSLHDDANNNNESVNDLSNAIIAKDYHNSTSSKDIIDDMNNTEMGSNNIINGNNNNSNTINADGQELGSIAISSSSGSARCAGDIDGYNHGKVGSGSKATEENADNDTREKLCCTGNGNGLMGANGLAPLTPMEKLREASRMNLDERSGTRNRTLSTTVTPIRTATDRMLSPSDKRLSKRKSKTHDIWAREEDDDSTSTVDNTPRCPISYNEVSTHKTRAPGVLTVSSKTSRHRRHTTPCADESSVGKWSTQNASREGFAEGSVISEESETHTLMLEKRLNKIGPIIYSCWDIDGRGGFDINWECVNSAIDQIALNLDMDLGEEHNLDRCDICATFEWADIPLLQ